MFGRINKAKRDLDTRINALSIERFEGRQYDDATEEASGREKRWTDSLNPAEKKRQRMAT